MSWDSNHTDAPFVPYTGRPRPRLPRRSPSLVVGGLLLLVFFLCAVVGGGGVYLYWHNHGDVHDPNAAPRAVTPRGDLAADEKATIELYNATRACVVHITTLVDVRRDSLSLNVQQVPEGTGSGFIWDQSGNVVTNYHVIQNADAAQVTLWDHSTWKARLVGAYADKDLAVLHIDAPGARLHPIPIGRSADLQVGQKAFAIGNPFGLDQTLTDGIVSALGREIESVTKRPIRNVIQTNAAINPGNSGGPLLDSAGRLIGVNTAIYSPSGSSAGIGFAIPVDEVNDVVPQLIRSGKVTRPGIGVHVASDQIMHQLDQKGALILSIAPNSPASKAGLRATRKDNRGHLLLGDVIVSIDDHAIESPSDFFSVLEQYKAGDTVALHVIREGQAMEVSVALAANGS
jgi:S1-C subfamily serine protease